MNTELHITEVYGDELAKHLLHNVDSKLVVYMSEVIRDLPSRIRHIGLLGVDGQDFFDEDDRGEAYHDARRELWIELDTLRKIVNLFLPEEHQLPNFFVHFEISEKLDEFHEKVTEARKRKIRNRPDSLRSYAGVYLKVPNTAMPEGEMCYGIHTEKFDDESTLMVWPAGTMRKNVAWVRHYVSRGAKVARVIGNYSRSIDSKPLP